MGKLEKNDQQKQEEIILHRLIQTIDNEPNNYNHYYDLSVFLIDLKNYTQAEELLLKALKLFDNRGIKIIDKLTYGLGNVYYAFEEYSKAIEQYMKVKDNKLQKDAYLMLSQSYMGAGNHKSALAFALTANEYDDIQDAVVNELIATNFLALGYFQEAANYFDLVLASQPENGRAQFDRGVIAVILEQESTTYFKQAQYLDIDYYEKGQQRLSNIQIAIKQHSKK